MSWARIDRLGRRSAVTERKLPCHVRLVISAAAGGVLNLHVPLPAGAATPRAEPPGPRADGKPEKKY